MSDWIKTLETILKNYGVPYDALRNETDETQLPDKYIVYSPVDDDPTYYDGKQFAHQPLCQVALYSRDKADVIEFPPGFNDLLEAAGFVFIRPVFIPYQSDTGHYGVIGRYKIYERRS